MQADTDIQGSQGVQGFNRYSYVNNNPIRYIDLSGHIREDGATGGNYVYEPDQPTELSTPPAAPESPYCTNYNNSRPG